jgi:hypothetical protein
MTERRYRLAVDTLERLIVGRLFEMTKLGMRAVGEFSFAYLIGSLSSCRV